MIKMVKTLFKFGPTFSKSQYYAEVEKAATLASSRLARGNIVRQEGLVLSEQELECEREHFIQKYSQAG